jgi:hypothetical protein
VSIIDTKKVVSNVVGHKSVSITDTRQVVRTVDHKSVSIIVTSQCVSNVVDCIDTTVARQPVLSAEFIVPHASYSYLQ